MDSPSAAQLQAYPVQLKTLTTREISTGGKVPKNRRDLPDSPVRFAPPCLGRWRRQRRQAGHPSTQGAVTPPASLIDHTQAHVHLRCSNIVCSLGKIFRFTKEDLKQTSLKTENRKILCCLFIT